MLTSRKLNKVVVDCDNCPAIGSCEAPFSCIEQLKDRLYSFEKLGYEPEELLDILNKCGLVDEEMFLDD